MTDAAQQDYDHLLSLYQNERWPEVLRELVAVKHRQIETEQKLAKLWERFVQAEVKA